MTLIGLLKEISIFLLAILIHELGHYVMYWRIGIKPRLRITYMGIFLDIPTEFMNVIRARQFIFVSLGGIIAGLMVLSFFNMEQEIYTIYAIVCCMDITNIVNLIPYWKNNNSLEQINQKLREAKQ